MYVYTHKFFCRKKHTLKNTCIPPILKLVGMGGFRAWLLGPNCDLLNTAVLMVATRDQKHFENHAT